MKNLSVAIIARNEEATIGKLIDSLGFADEIIVIDTGSDDKTVPIAKKMEAKVISYRFADNFAEARNFAMSQAKNEWIFFVDADEIPSSKLLDWLKNFDPDHRVSAYAFRRLDHFWGKTMLHGETGTSYPVRLVNKTGGRFLRPVHETWETKNDIYKSPLVIDHYPHQSIKEFLEHINFYSSINASYFLSQNKKASVIDLTFTPVGKFLYTYFLKFGFLDGPAGFVYSFMMSFHSFLTRAKLYTMQDK